MSATAAVFMIVVCGAVWGGFVTLLVRMVGTERRKSASGNSEKIP